MFENPFQPKLLRPMQFFTFLGRNFPSPVLPSLCPSVRHHRCPSFPSFVYLSDPLSVHLSAISYIHLSTCPLFPLSPCPRVRVQTSLCPPVPPSLPAAGDGRRQEGVHPVQEVQKGNQAIQVT